MSPFFNGFVRSRGDGNLTPVISFKNLMIKINTFGLCATIPGRLFLGVRGLILDNSDSCSSRGRTTARSSKVEKFMTDNLSSASIPKDECNCYNDGMGRGNRHPATFFKVAIFFAWLLLFGLLLRRDIFISTIDPKETLLIEQAEREDYQGIYFQDRRIGYAVTTYSPHKDRTQTLEQRARMNLNVAGSINTIDLRLKALLGPDGRLRDFTFFFHSPFYRMQADGRVNGNRITYNLSTGSTAIHDSLDLSAPPMLSTSRQAYLLQRDLKEGQKFKIPSFDPLTLTGQDVVIEYRGRERVLIHDRVQNLHHFVEIFSGARVNSWLDDTGEVIKEESPAGFVFLKEPKFKALAGKAETPELLAAVSARLVGTMPRLDTLKQMRYRLQFPDDGSFQLNSGRQRYVDGLLTIDRESLSDFMTKNTPPSNTDAADLAATAYVQSDNPKIRKVADDVVAGRTGSLDRVKALAEYVNTHLEKRPVLGLPDALTVLNSGKGDCNEHAVLFAALARASGIPCRLVAGVMYFKEAFYYHAWNEVRLNGRWLSLDTTTNQLPADLSHIKFIEGGIKEQMRIGALLGQLSIEPLTDPVSRQPPVKETQPNP
jgi:transglutaminase/protease-like cytokinesis protein 3